MRTNFKDSIRFVGVRGADRNKKGKVNSGRKETFRREAPSFFEIILIEFNCGAVEGDVKCISKWRTSRRQLFPLEESDLWKLSWDYNGRKAVGWRCHDLKFLWRLMHIRHSCIKAREIANYSLNRTQACFEINLNHNTISIDKCEN